MRRYNHEKRKLYHYIEAFAVLPKVNRELLAVLGLLVEKSEEAVKGLTQLDCLIDSNNVWLLHFIVKKLKLLNIGLSMISQ